MCRAPIAALIALAIVATACAGAPPSSAPPSMPSAPPAPAASASSSTAPLVSPTASASTAVLLGESWIAFQTNGANGYGVYLVREDGTGLHHWPSGIIGGYEHPDWSPDGERIMVNSIEPDGTEDIWSARADGSDTVRHIDCAAPCVWADEASWSPDGTRIAFQRLVDGDDGLTSTLEILDLAANAVTVVLSMPDLEVVLAPRWSPDGSHLVVEVVHLPEPSLEVDPDGGGIGVVDLTVATPVVEMLVPFETFAQSPDWSPDGREFIYAQPSAADADLLDLHGIAPDGSSERRITDLAASGGSAIQPAFTPDGQRILFVLTRSGRQETVMAVVGVDGSDLGPIGGSDFRDGFHPRLRPTP